MRWIAFLGVLFLLGSISILDASAETGIDSQVSSSFAFSENTAAGQVGNRTDVNFYASEGTTWFVGPSVGQTPSPDAEYFLRAYKNGDNRIHFQLYVILKSRHHWWFFDRALDTNGNKLQVKSIGVDWESGWKTEHLLIQLSRRYLNRLAAKMGLSLKVMGKQGEIVLNVPSFYVKGFLRKVEFWRRVE
jgi:hypothetical protein